MGDMFSSATPLKTRPQLILYKAYWRREGIQFGEIYARLLAAKHGKPVKREVEIFTSHGRHLIPIYFGDCFDDLDREQHPVLGRIAESTLYIEEETEGISKGPSDSAIQEILRTHKIMRRRTLRSIAIAIPIAAVIAFSVFTSVSWVAAITASKQEKAARLLADEEERESRHQLGGAWLARARFCERNRDHLSAKLMGMHANNYNGYGGSESKDRILLRRDSTQFNEAGRFIAGLREFNILYIAHIDMDPYSWGECRFSRDGTKVMAISGSGQRIELSLINGGLQRSRYSTGSTDRLSTYLRSDGEADVNDFGHIHLTDRTGINIPNDGIDLSSGTFEWLDVVSGSVTDSIEIDESYLQTVENEEPTPELIDIQSATDVPVVAVSFRNTFSQFVLLFNKHSGTTKEIYQSTREATPDGSGLVESIGISGDGSLVALGMSDGTLRIRHGANADFVANNQPLTRIAVSYDGKFIAVASGNDIRLWRSDENRLIATLTGHKASVTDIDFCLDNGTLASLSSDGMLIVWDIPVVDLQPIDIREMPKSVRDMIVGDEESINNWKSDPTAKSADGIWNASWKHTSAYGGIADTFSFGTLTIQAVKSGSEVFDYNIYSDYDFDLPEPGQLRFSPLGPFAIIYFDENDSNHASMIPIHRPKTTLDYHTAYSVIDFTDTGIRVRKDVDAIHPVQVMPPSSMSTTFLTMNLPPSLLSKAIKWYYEAKKIPLEEPAW